MIRQGSPKPPLFTVGHSDHELTHFIALLNRHGITAVADVRSSPFSRLHPQFNRDLLADQLQRHGISYVFLGRELGARRHEREAYRGSQASYDLIARLPLFLEGLARVRKGLLQHRVSLMCAERDPLTCHRTILVCRQLRNEFDIQHILADGNLESHTDAELRLRKLTGLHEQDLFQSPDDQLDLAYERQGQRIAYTESQDEPSAGRGVA